MKSLGNNHGTLLSDIQIQPVMVEEPHWLNDSIEAEKNNNKGEKIESHNVLGRLAFSSFGGSQNSQKKDKGDADSENNLDSPKSNGGKNKHSLEDLIQDDSL
mgnify:CR=1 FL=1